jgi:carboxylate-amine ligase
MAGPPQPFASRDEYEALVRALVATGSIEDATKIYWDVRLPERVATIEFRVTDVCLRVDEAVMIAGLVRGLVQTCAAQARTATPYVAARPELVQAAHWRAARYGLEGELLDVDAKRAVPAHRQIEMLLDFVRVALETNGDWDEIAGLVQDTLEHGNGATRQRQVYQRTGRLEDVVDFIIEETAHGTLLE